MEKSFAESVKARRSCYGIGKEVLTGRDELTEMLEFALLNVPSSFNSQSQRVALLLEETHQKLWSIVMETLRKIVPSEKFGRTESKINGFAAGYGTVLYFDDTSATNCFKLKFPLYKDNFDIWAEQANGMLQFTIWTLLENMGLGASLQHYNPLINQEVNEIFGFPESWRLIAQMPFGNITAPIGVKNFIPMSERLRVLS